MQSPYLFDLDGTLVDSLPDIAASTNALRAHCGLPPASLDAVRGMVGDGMITLLQRALAEADIPVSDDLIAFYRDHYDAQCIVLTQPFPGVRTCLEAWHTAGHPLGVVTNKPRDFARKILDHLDLSALLPVVIGGDSLPVRKPDPGPVRAGLAELGAADIPGGMMVGDSVVDIRAGRSAGLRTVAALFGYQPEADLRAAEADTYWSAFGRPE